MASCRPVVISGPSGSGKGTLLERLIEEFKNTFAFCISHTTRKPRPGEVHGTHYYFVEQEKFDEMRRNNEFLEHAEFSNNLYGTSKKAVTSVQQTGCICILEVDINGVKNLKKCTLDARYLFIKPPSLESLRQRLQDRGTETEESLSERLATAKEAIDFAEQPNVYDHIIVNDDIDKAYTQLRKILIKDIEALKKDPV